MCSVYYDRGNIYTSLEYFMLRCREICKNSKYKYLKVQGRCHDWLIQLPRKIYKWNKTI